MSKTMCFPDFLSSLPFSPHPDEYQAYESLLLVQGLGSHQLDLSWACWRKVKILQNRSLANKECQWRQWTGWQTKVHGLNLPVFINKVLWEQCLKCFALPWQSSELSSCNRDLWSANIYYLVLYRKSLPTPV